MNAEISLRLVVCVPFLILSVSYLTRGTVLAANGSNAADIPQKTVHKIEGGLLDKIINRKSRRGVLTEPAAKRRIDALINANAEVKTSIDDLVGHDPSGTLNAKRNRAIFAVYLENAIFRDAVDAELAR